eukprot:scaffold246911_cov33-Tisochrysis_lutea.AAC.1
MVPDDICLGIACMCYHSGVWRLGLLAGALHWCSETRVRTTASAPCTRTHAPRGSYVYDARQAATKPAS